MNKLTKVIVFISSILAVTVLVGVAYVYYFMNHKFIPSEHLFTERVAYIDSETSLKSENFETCSDYIFDYYNPERATYSKGKNGLRKLVLENYQNKGYSDSGYLTFRFLINCKGESGRYVIHQNDLELEPTKLNYDLVQQLYTITLLLDQWNPNIIEEEAVDSYMYITYRIEHGEITEILP